MLLTNEEMSLQAGYVGEDVESILQKLLVVHDFFQLTYHVPEIIFQVFLFLNVPVDGSHKSQLTTFSRCFDEISKGYCESSLAQREKN